MAQEQLLPWHRHMTAKALKKSQCHLLTFAMGFLRSRQNAFNQGTAMAAFTPILLLFASNVFMTFAWYGQLKFPNAVLWQVVLISWGIAFFEYCLAVPANRIGHQVYSAAQLKTMQEIITLLVFAVFSVTYLGESLKWNHMVAFLFLCGAAFFSFHKWS
jgi:uncharacterized protein (DUF486 family)